MEETANEFAFIADSIPRESTPGAAGRAENNKKIRSTKRLACYGCRRKKVKCQPGPTGETKCSLCFKLDADCYMPSTDERRRSHTRMLIQDLQAENARLRTELEEHRSICLMGDSMSISLSASSVDGRVESRSPGTSPDMLSSSGPSDYSVPQQSVAKKSKSDNMIVRLCGGERQLHSDRVGRLRYFGPTSSLHLMESVTSSVLMCHQSSGMTSLTWQDDFPPEVEEYLLDLYWKYQHQVLPCIHKESFLRDMRNGDTKYCSKLLVYCILTRACAISDQPGLRALALADDAEDDAPYLVRKCVQLLDADLDRPGITTAQSLQLLSDMHCAVSHDTKGWMYAGGAGRLAYELGLHRDSATFDTNLSELDQQVRRVVFWGCFNLDREWALYLGRPQFLKLEDIDAKRPGQDCQEVSLELMMSAAWTALLEIVGQICDVLNGVHTPRHHLETLDSSLRSWQDELDPSLKYNSFQTPAVFLLHMQYAAAMILLHRPLADFGKDPKQRVAASEVSRGICVRNACDIAQYLQEYFNQHGSVLTMSWIALHIVATAATTLIGNIAERRADVEAEHQLDCLRQCLGALNELEKSHVVTRRVRKVIQHAIRLLNLDATLNVGGGSAWKVGGLQQNNASIVTPMSLPAMTDFEMSQFPLIDLLPSSNQFEMLNSFESYFR
ncbi:fungal-specific transcription factor domain-containing protein [Coniochaeta sp. 2T2.1]|nr:fungal-specific transcription factor domain-containing protein [Coniochaeta sp. 2T2.1]